MRSFNYLNLKPSDIVVTREGRAVRDLRVSVSHTDARSPYTIVGNVEGEVGTDHWTARGRFDLDMRSEFDLFIKG